MALYSPCLICRKSLIVAACAALLCLLSGRAAFAVTWIGFFPAIPNAPGGPPSTGPGPVTPPTIPPIFNWIEPPPTGPSGQSGPPPTSPPGTIAPSPEPATIIGSLIALSALGVMRISRRRWAR